MHQTPLTSLAANLVEAEKLIPIGSIFFHYKHPGAGYVIIGFAIIESTEEVAVLYSPESNPDVTFSRPLSEWVENIEIEGKMIPRFSLKKS